MHIAVGLVFAALFLFIPAFLIGRLARRRGRESVGYFAAALFIPWPIVLGVLLCRARRARRYPP